MSLTINPNGASQPAHAEVARQQAAQDHQASSSSGGGTAEPSHAASFNVLTQSGSTNAPPASLGSADAGQNADDQQRQADDAATVGAQALQNANDLNGHLNSYLSVLQ